ncbi:MAG: methyltransferase [Bacteroidetes bacterium]|nr:methyltransferase [Bacteroidota bacterium]
MKVGTDGVLLGAWACTGTAARILDIGTGTGLLALIAAQRFPAAWIDAVEIDGQAAGQAWDNVSNSPWQGRISIHTADARHWNSQERYDLVLCNPPFYKGHRPSQNERLAQAKHEASLNLPGLLMAIERHCGTTGKAALVLPVERLDELAASGRAHGFSVSRLCMVRHLAGRPPKRVLVELRQGTAGVATQEELVVQLRDGAFSPAYKALLADLELHF